MTPEQIACDILTYIGEQSEIAYGDEANVSFGDAQNMIATALRQAREDALEEAKIAVKKLDYKRNSFNDWFPPDKFDCIDAIDALKHKDQK